MSPYEYSPNGFCIVFLHDFSSVDIIWGFWTSLDQINRFGENRRKHPGSQVSGWTYGTRVQKLRVYLSITACTFGLLWGKVCNLRSCLQLLSCSIGSTFGDKYDLILALSQIFEYLCEPICRRALEYLQSARSEKNKIKLVFPMGRPDHCWAFWRPVVGGDTFSPIAPVLGPEQKKNWLCHPLPLLSVAVSMILCDIPVVIACAIRGGQNLGREAWASS